MALAARLAIAAIPVTLSLAVAACGSARVGAPVPRPFPLPAGVVVDREHRAVSMALWGGADFRRYLEVMAAVESGGDCFARPAGSSAIGCYQMTRAALMDAGFKDARGRWLDNVWGIDSDDEFQRSRRVQDAAMLRYTMKNWLKLEPCVWDLIGRTIGGVAIDQAALVAGAHLLGATGLVRFIRCGLKTRCISPEAAALNGGARNLRAIAIRRMNAARGLRVLQATAGSGSRCGLPKGVGDRSPVRCGADEEPAAADGVGLRLARVGSELAVRDATTRASAHAAAAGRRTERRRQTERGVSPRYPSTGGRIRLARKR